MPFGPNLISVFSELPVLRFATDNGIDKVVTVQSGRAGDRQIWFVDPVGENDIYTITAGPCPPEPGASGLRRDLFKGPNDVVNSPLPGKWRFVPVEGFPNVFEIHPADNIIGVIELLGTQRDNVVIKTFPIGEPIEKHSWRFEQVQD